MTVIDLAIQGSVLVVGYVKFGAWPDPSMLWWMLPGFLLVTLVGLGLGMIRAAANVYLRDLGYPTDAALQVGFWMIPILYSYLMVETAPAQQPALLVLSSAHPAVPAANALRLALWPAASAGGGQGYLMEIGQTVSYLFAGLPAGLLLVWFGQLCSARVSGGIAQKL